jgi:hypothetical protein
VIDLIMTVKRDPPFSIVKERKQLAPVSADRAKWVADVMLIVSARQTTAELMTRLAACYDVAYARGCVDGLHEASEGLKAIRLAPELEP